MVLLTVMAVSGGVIWLIWDCSLDYLLDWACVEGMESWYPTYFNYIISRGDSKNQVSIFDILYNVCVWWSSLSASWLLIPHGRKLRRTLMPGRRSGPRYCSGRLRALFFLEWFIWSDVFIGRILFIWCPMLTHSRNLCLLLIMQKWTQIYLVRIEAWDGWAFLEFSACCPIYYLHNIIWWILESIQDSMGCKNWLNDVYAQVASRMTWVMT